MKTTDKPLNSATVDQLANALAPCTLPTGIHDRLAQRLRLACAAPSRPGIDIQRDADGRWIPVLPGVEIRILHHNRTTRELTSLWRLQAGAQLPAHDHEHADEECLILDGDICHGEDQYLPGDYMIGHRGSHHGVISSRRGGTMLLRCSDHHVPAELLAEASGVAFNRLQR